LPVGPQQPENGSGGRLEIDAVQGRYLPEALGQTGERECGGGDQPNAGDDESGPTSADGISQRPPRRDRNETRKS
jgi:hypothetical protein